MITDLAKDEGLDGIIIDTIKLHSADPGAAGTLNEVADTSTAVVLAAASAGVRAMASSLDISVPADTISHYSLWGGSSLKSTNAFGTPETYSSPGIAEVPTAVLTAA
jgi:hypothetical protein